MRRVLVIGGVVALVLACGEIRDDEMQCEEAIARLDDCCPDIDTHRFVCIYSQGCGGSQLTPDFSTNGSKCIHDKSCEELQSSGSCDSLRELAKGPHAARYVPLFDQEACR